MPCSTLIQGKSCSSGALSARAAYTAERLAHWNRVAGAYPEQPVLARYYHRKIGDVYRSLIAPGQRVLEVGCGRGDLLASLKPSYGVGVDFSEAMLVQARERHPHLHFICADVHRLPMEEPFDAILVADLLNDLWDVQHVLQQLHRLTTAHTRVILNFYSRLWQMPLGLARYLGMACPLLPQNWLTAEDVGNLLKLAEFEVLRHWGEVLWPLRIPLLDTVANRFLAKVWPFCLGTLTNFMIARPQRAAVPEDEEPVVSVVVPARNEAGNIEDIFERVPDMGRKTELVFVEGHSHDDTFGVIQRAMETHPERCCKLVRQTGKGKGDAVRLGFTEASGEAVMILDSDLTMPPEDLPRFYEALRLGKGELINGVRLVYPMEKRAMRFLNLLGNKFFSLAFSWLLGQPIKDTLCGTKALWKKDYRQLAAQRAYFGEFDPFGDFDLLFGAAKLGLKIVDLPIRYQERSYGTTNIRRWRHGWLLLKMVAFAAWRIKFV